MITSTDYDEQLMTKQLKLTCSKNLAQDKNV